MTDRTALAVARLLDPDPGYTLFLPLPMVENQQSLLNRSHTRT